jgi:transposase/transcriptional regulator with XRE-family HTH domain
MDDLATEVAHLVPDRLWRLVYPLLPSVRSHRGRRTQVGDRAVLAGIVHVVTTPVAWRALPESWGLTVSTVYRRYARWTDAGVWSALLQRAEASDDEWARLVADAALARSGNLSRRVASGPRGPSNVLPAAPPVRTMPGQPPRVRGQRDARPVETYSLTLGDELRAARLRRGWTRQQLQSRVCGELSLQSLAAYELGARRLSVVRLIELCTALSVLPSQVVARACERALEPEQRDGLSIDLDHIVRSTGPELSALRAWARTEIKRSSRSRNRIVHIGRPALDQLATACGSDAATLLGALQDMALT